MRFFFRSSCIVAVDLALVAAALQAQPAASRPVERFEDRASVVEVQVPVSVVDRSGAPVHGLQIQDFELYDQGRLQQISDVAVYDLAVAASETGRLDNSPALPSAARRHFLLLFDLSFSRPSQILRARQAARELVLTRLHPQDLVAVMVYSLEHGPRMIITFTPDRAQLARAIDTLGMDRDPSHSASLDPLRFMLAEDAITSTTTSSSADQGRAGELRAAMEQVQLEYMNQLAIAAEKDQKAFERSRITAFTRSLGEMARQLDAVRGRKQVLLFSEGFDSRLLLGRGVEDESEREKEQADLNSGRSWQVDSDNRFGNTGLQNDVTRMIEEFRRADCVIQAVDIGGLRAGGEMNRPGRSLGQDALFVMANETGGRLFKEANDLGRRAGSRAPEHALDLRADLRARARSSPTAATTACASSSRTAADFSSRIAPATTPRARSRISIRWRRACSPPTRSPAPRRGTICASTSWRRRSAAARRTPPTCR